MGRNFGLPWYLVGGRTPIRDARRRPFRLCDPSSLPPDAPTEVRKAVVAAGEHRLPAAAAQVGGGLVSVAIARWLFDVAGCRHQRPGLPPYPPDSPQRILLTGLIFAAVVISLMVWLSALRARRRADLAVNACLHARICPGCGYPLGPLDQGGESLCCECSAAWGVRSLDQDAPPSAAVTSAGEGGGAGL